MIYYIGVALLLVIIVGLFLWKRVPVTAEVPRKKYVSKGRNVYAPNGTLFGQYMSNEVAWNVARHLNGDYCER